MPKSANYMLSSEGERPRVQCREGANPGDFTGKMEVTMQNRTIENPIIKDSVTFVKTADETNGEYTELIVELAPGGGNEPHYHRSFTESFTPLQGQLGVLIGKQKRLLHPGETATVPPGAVHCFFNPSDQRIRFRGEARPGHRGSEQFIQIAYGLARDGYVNSKGYPNRISHIALLSEMGDMHLPGLAFKLFSPCLQWIARRARAAGLEKKLIERYCK